MNLLIVDDERNIRRFMKNALERQNLGFKEIYTAKNGIEALEIAKQKHPNIIITDIVMPWLTGHQLVFKIQEFNPSCVFIMISGHDDFAYLQEAIRLQVFRYLLKPISLQTLLEAVTEAIAESEQRQLADEQYSNDRLFALLEQQAELDQLELEHIAQLKASQASTLQELSVLSIKTATFLFAVIERYSPQQSYNAFDMIYQIHLLKAASAEEIITACKALYDKVRHAEQNETWQKHAPTIRMACDYMERHYMDNIGASEVAAHCGISAGYLSTLFNQSIDSTIPQYINNVRMKHALELMQTSTLTLQEVATACGFSSANYFSKVFKSKYGESPSEIKGG